MSEISPDRRNELLSKSLLGQIIISEEAVTFGGPGSGRHKGGGSDSIAKTAQERPRNEFDKYVAREKAKSEEAAVNIHPFNNVLPEDTAAARTVIPAKPENQHSTTDAIKAWKNVAKAHLKASQAHTNNADDCAKNGKQEDANGHVATAAFQKATAASADAMVAAIKANSGSFDDTNNAVASHRHAADLYKNATDLYNKNADGYAAKCSGECGALHTHAANIMSMSNTFHHPISKALSMLGLGS